MLSFCSSLDENTYYCFLTESIGWLRLKRNLLEMVSRFFNQEDYHVMHLEKAVLGCHHLSWMTWRWKRRHPRKPNLVLGEIIIVKRRYQWREAVAVEMKRSYTLYLPRRLNLATYFLEIVACIIVQSFINLKDVNRAVEKSQLCGIIPFKQETKQ